MTLFLFVRSLEIFQGMEFIWGFSSMLNGRGSVISFYHMALGTGIASLPSVVALALGKEACFAECHIEHSAKNLTKGPAGGSFAECMSIDTRQRGNFFAECNR
jgi:hypothetical protein